MLFCILPPTLYTIANAVSHNQRYAPSHCIPPPTLAKQPFPDMSAPNTSPYTSPDTSPYPKTSSCAGGTLSAHAALRLNKNPAHISSCFSNPFTYQTYTRRIYPCISISFFARRIYFSCFYTFYSMLKCSCSSYFIFF